MKKYPKASFCWIDDEIPRYSATHPADFEYVQNNRENLLLIAPEPFFGVTIEELNSIDDFLIEQNIAPVDRIL